MKIMNFEASRARGIPVRLNLIQPARDKAAGHSTNL
jgi:hypothetical protein